MINVQILGLLLQLVVLVHGATPTPPTEAAPSASGDFTSTSLTITSSPASSNLGNSSTVTIPSSTSTAQWPSLSNVSDCIFNCNNLAFVQLNCSSIVDVGCYCQSQFYQRFVIECVSLRCPDQLTQTIELAKNFCAVSSISISFAVTSFSTSVPSPTPTTTVSTPTSTNTSGSTTSTGLPRPGIYVALSALVVAAILPALIFLG